MDHNYMSYDTNQRCNSLKLSAYKWKRCILFKSTRWKSICSAWVRCGLEITSIYLAMKSQLSPCDLLSWQQQWKCAHHQSKEGLYDEGELKIEAVKRFTSVSNITFFAFSRTEPQSWALPLFPLHTGLSAQRRCTFTHDAFTGSAPNYTRNHN